MSNFTKLHLTHEIFRILPVFSQFLWNLTFIFSDSHEKFSLGLLQMTNYIFSPWKMYKRMQHALNYSDTRFFVHWKLKLPTFLGDSVLNYHHHHHHHVFSTYCIVIYTWVIAHSTDGSKLRKCLKVFGINFLSI